MEKKLWIWLMLKTGGSVNELHMKKSARSEDLRYFFRTARKKICKSESNLLLPRCRKKLNYWSSTTHSPSPLEGHIKVNNLAMRRFAWERIHCKSCIPNGNLELLRLIWPVHIHLLYTDIDIYLHSHSFSIIMFRFCKEKTLIRSHYTLQCPIILRQSHFDTNFTQFDSTSIRHSRQYLNTILNTSFIKNTPLPVVLSTLFSEFGNVIKWFSQCLTLLHDIYYFILTCSPFKECAHIFGQLTNSSRST